LVTKNLGPCVLEGDFVPPEPLRTNHSVSLWEAAQKLDWTWFLNPLRSMEALEKKIQDGLEAEERNQEFAFAVLLKEGHRVIGSTAYLTVVAKHKRAEIGSSWHLPEVQGTFVNPESKLLLLRHAFEDWGAVRVQLTTDVNNAHSNRAILKLGAKFEGVLRNHGIRPDGSVRDAMLYSIVAREWPEVKARLLDRVQGFKKSTPQKTS
jgi:RimJ/RimL family protein N-acetyltransferase